MQSKRPSIMSISWPIARQRGPRRTKPNLLPLMLGRSPCRLRLDDCQGPSYVGISWAPWPQFATRTAGLHEHQLGPWRLKPRFAKRAAKHHRHRLAQFVRQRGFSRPSRASAGPPCLSVCRDSSPASWTSAGPLCDAHDARPLALPSMPRAQLPSIMGIMGISWGPLAAEGSVCKANDQA